MNSGVLAAFEPLDPFRKPRNNTTSALLLFPIIKSEIIFWEKDSFPHFFIFKGWWFFSEIIFKRFHSTPSFLRRKKKICNYSHKINITFSQGRPFWMKPFKYSYCVCAVCVYWEHIYISLIDYIISPYLSLYISFQTIYLQDKC